MNNFSRSGAWLLVVLAMLLLPVCVQAQSLLSPAPGSIFKEYTRALTGGNSWRVTDPNTPRADARSYLPNDVLSLSIGDLSGATRAEILIDMWGGHVGTTNKRFRFNNNNWITIPELGSGNGIPAGHDGQCYSSQSNPVVAIPLSHLRTGSNSFQGTSGGQTCYNFNWGQWGWYGVVVRIYYGSSKPHPTGSITSPSAGGTIGDSPRINVSTGGSVSEVRLLGYYNGFDPDGDGVRLQYNYAYHRFKSETSLNMKYHIGTDNASPYSIEWNTSLVPDQSGVKLVAWIKGTDGTIFVTNEITNVRMQRSSAYVRVYRVTNMPERFWVRSGRTTKTVNFTIPSGDALSTARSATLVIPSWNGDDVSERSRVTTRVNSWTTPDYGSDHHFELDFINLPISALRQGVNDFTVIATTVEHGVEISWPGPHVIVRFGGVATNQPPSITLQPSDRNVLVGQLVVFNVAASGTAPLSYQWQRNNVNISGATDDSYTIASATLADNGATFRCIVSNAYGNATSNAATLGVTGGGNTPPSITQEPQPQTVQVGTSASFAVTASGSGTLVYQWQKNSANIGGATAASYSTPATLIGDNGARFRCIVSNSYGRDTSASALLAVTTGVPATNLIANPGFESGTSPWSFFTSGAGTFTSAAPGYEGSRAGRVAVTSGGTNVQLYQEGRTLQAGRRYRLTFSAYSSSGHDVAVFIHKHGTPYNNYGVNNAVFGLGTGWQTFTRDFTASGFTGTVTDARLRFWLAPYDAAGDTYFFDGVKLEVLQAAEMGDSPLAGGAEARTPEFIPTAFSLGTNYPNPFNPSTTIEFGIPEDATVRLAVYNTLGQEIAVLADGDHSPGVYSVVWEARGIDGSSASSGVYFYRMVAAGKSGKTYSSLLKMVLLK